MEHYLEYGGTCDVVLHKHCTYGEFTELYY